MLALPRSGTTPAFAEKNSEGVEIGESLPAGLIEEPNQSTRGGQGISVGPVAIRDSDPIMPCKLVEIAAPQPREKAARHLDRAQALDVGNLTDGFG